MQKQYFAGIDVGSSMTKAVIINAKKEIMGFGVNPSGVNFEYSANSAYQTALKNANLTPKNIKYIVSTGYGRENVAFANETKTEISCHGKGAYYYYPTKITIIDIGGQDTKIIKFNERGELIGFKANRKCAAGTGTFLEEIANRLKVSPNDLDKLARNATKEITLSSYCTVFAGTEIITRIKEGETRENIIRGAFDSVVKRVLEIDSIAGEVVITGGVVAYNRLITDLLAKRLDLKINVPPNPQIIGAFGAALYAASSYSKRT